MATRKFELSEEEIRAFRQREAESRDSAEVRRVQAVRLYGSRRSVADITEVSGCTESSLRRWVGHYQQRGLAGLQADYARSAQNASKLSAKQRSDLRQQLQQYHPDQVIRPAVRISQGQLWTVSDLQLVVEQWYGVVYADNGSYCHLFHACGFSYQRAESAYKSRPSEANIADFEAQLEKK